MKEARQRRLTDGWGWGDMQGQDADTAARERDGRQHGNTCKTGAPWPPHAVSDDGFSSWLMTDSERHHRDSPAAHKQALSATETWG